MYTTIAITLLVTHVLFVILECVLHRRGLDLPAASNTQDVALASDSSIPVLETPVVDGTRPLLAT